MPDALGHQFKMMFLPRHQCLNKPSSRCFKFSRACSLSFPNEADASVEDGSKPLRSRALVRIFLPGFTGDPASCAAHVSAVLGYAGNLNSDCAPCLKYLTVVLGLLQNGATGAMTANDLIGEGACNGVWGAPASAAS